MYSFTRGLDYKMFNLLAATNTADEVRKDGHSIAVMYVPANYYISANSLEALDLFERLYSAALYKLNEKY